MIVRVPPLAWKADLALVATTFIWGATFLLVKTALDSISVFVFLALRFGLAALALMIIFRPLSSKFWAGKTLVKASLGAAVLMMAGFVFQTTGLKYTTASKSAFITGLCVVLVPILSAAVARKRPHLSEWIGVTLAAIGLGLMTLQGQSLRMGKGDLLTLFCAMAFAGHIVMIGHYAPRVGFQAFTLVQVAAVAILAAGAGPFVETPLLKPVPIVYLAVGVTGILATAVAFSIQAWAQQYTTATRTALIFALEPVFAWLTSFLIAGELLSSRAVFGALLILAGILLAELKPISLK